MTWRNYEEVLYERVYGLHREIHAGAYRAKLSRRVFIPKADGRQRPLGIASLEKKVVQQAVMAVLNTIYEEDFLGFSYGWTQLRGTSIAKKIYAGKLPVAWISAPAEKARSDQRLVILATASPES